jgi:hypothetical protein
LQPYDAGQRHRGAAVRAVFVHQPDRAVLAAKGDEVVAQQPHALRRASGFQRIAAW